jgi:hypothetical protein
MRMRFVRSRCKTGMLVGGNMVPRCWGDRSKQVEDTRRMSSSRVIVFGEGMVAVV